MVCFKGPVLRYAGLAGCAHSLFLQWMYCSVLEWAPESGGNQIILCFSTGLFIINYFVGSCGLP